MYDKLKDLYQSKAVGNKRAFEAESDLQENLFEANFPKQMEVLRLEIRLNKRQKIRSLFAKLNIDAEITFEGVYSADISKAVLKHFYDEVLAEVKMVDLMQINNENPLLLAESIIGENPKLKPAKVAQLVGTMSLLQKSGAGALKSVFANNSKRTVDRMINDCKSLIPNKSARWLAIRNLQKQLDEFEPISMKKFETVKNLAYQ